MISGIGTDILATDKLYPKYLDKNDPFMKKAYTAAEMEAANNSDHKLMYLADRYAGKEAVFKALGINGEHVYLSEIEILNDADGIPHVTLYGQLKKLAEQKGICRIHISFSFEDKWAIAYAVAETE